MYCPNCAAKNSTEQSFCRSCGMNLEQTACSLVTQFPGGKAAKIERAEQLLERFGRIAFGGFGVVIAGGILFLIYMIITKMILSGTQVLAGVGAILFLLFAAVALTYVFTREDLKERRRRLRFDPNSPPELGGTNNELLTERSQYPIDSIIDDTTDLLPAQNRTRKLDS